MSYKSPTDKFWDVNNELWDEIDKTWDKIDKMMDDKTSQQNTKTGIIHKIVVKNWRERIKYAWRILRYGYVLIRMKKNEA